MAQSLITSETQQWLTRNWERHDHWPLITELCITMKVDPSERLERTQRRGEGTPLWFISHVEPPHCVHLISKRDKEFSHEKSHKMSRVAVLKSKRPSGLLSLPVLTRPSAQVQPCHIQLISESVSLKTESSKMFLS